MRLLAVSWRLDGLRTRIDRHLAASMPYPVLDAYLDAAQLEARALP